MPVLPLPLSPLPTPGKDFWNLAMLGGSIWAGWQFMTTSVPSVAIQMLNVVGVSRSAPGAGLPMLSYCRLPGVMLDKYPHAH